MNFSLTVFKCKILLKILFFSMPLPFSSGECVWGRVYGDKGAYRNSLTAS